MQKQPLTSNNPLQKFMRQPKLYITLPSNGMYWPKGSLEVTETGEFPVYSMTAKDELTLKVPDALLNGQGIVDVIQHCIPNIRNAWAIPNIDLDVILIAIRIATYGDQMKLPIKFGETEYDYQLDLRYVLDSLQRKITWEPAIQINPELVVYVKPFDYKTVSISATKTFETQRLIQAAASDTSMSETARAEVYNDAFKKLQDITVGIVNNSVYRVDTSSGSTEVFEFIQEFMNNVDKEISDVIKSHIERLKENNRVDPIRITPTQEMIELGCKEAEIVIPLEFDPSTFFG